MAGGMIPVAVPDVGDLEKRYVAEAAGSGWVSSLGEFIGRFETAFARFCEVEHGVSVANGTAAIEVTLKALGIGPGDEVILPALTFAAVPAAVVHLGAQPVLADVQPESWCLDPVAFERAVSARTRGVVAVHSYGHPVDLDPVIEVCRARGINLIEDCAEAHGARYKGRRVGSIGDAGTFSFYGNKIITTGEGGMVVTTDPILAERVRLLKDHAMDPSRRYYHLEAGYNFRMTNIQAALGCAQLERIHEFLDKRSSLLAWYREELEAVPGVELNPRMPWAEPVNWLACALLDAARADRRDRTLERLRAEGVDTRPFFVALGDLPPYREARRVGAVGEGTPVADDLSARGFNLPTSTLMTRDTVRGVAAKLAAVLSGS